MTHPLFDAYTKAPDELLTYSADAIPSFHIYGYEWIDNLFFLLPPSCLISNAARREALENAVRDRFTEADWEGTGNLSLLWLPPFIFPLEMQAPPEGVIVWHVKQHDDGISYLLSPVPLPFEEFTPP
ncbi:hypothetical protein [Prosthecobacter vanneervenii]|uniref:Uncharacterized protein n=1 Tax=Prosthecobacter vanneervenii TaxID=48466 RepID=A0A7W7Y6K0_9BACT|nr:hypothetical protein [Prosthecobacter vanneervenii]MBB5030553.1 hypothetical protein [Prosthecobacter vanneervenii]